LPTNIAPFSLTQVEQGERRDSKVFAVVDEDCGIPVSLVENYRGFNENGPLAHSDPRSVLLSMSEYDKSQSYDVYGTSSTYDLVAASEPGKAALGQSRWGGTTSM
jgi:hypothetical protein